jgi:hypothetical protein
MLEHPRWDSMRKVVDELQRGGWFTPKMLVEAINKHEEKKVNVRSVKHDLRLGSYIHIFKHDKSKSQYAWIDYDDDAEPRIQEAIIEYINISPQLREGKRSISNADIDEIIDCTAAKIGRDPRDLDFRKLVRGVIKKHNEKSIC